MPGDPESRPSAGRMRSPDTERRLGAHCVGRRVVVRRVLPGETGPTGGPAMTDVVGEMLSWGPSTVVVRPDRADVDPVEIPIADIVSGKPVPPRPEPRRPRRGG